MDQKNLRYEDFRKNPISSPRRGKVNDRKNIELNSWETNEDESTESFLITENGEMKSFENKDK